MTTDTTRSPMSTNGVTALSQPAEPVHYPDSDGKPMAENDWQLDEITRLVDTLRELLRQDPDAYVSGNILCYYEEGNPRHSFSPDVLVALGAGKHRRETYLLWQEPTPALVMEVTSPSTRRADQVRKRNLYARLGIGEYYLYDPRALYLRPPFQGYRLVDGVYLPLLEDTAGGLISPSLGVRFVLRDGVLRVEDPLTGSAQLSRAERTDQAEAQARSEREARQAAEVQTRAERDARQLAEAQARADREARQAAEAQASTEREARQAAEARAQAAERALAALRAQLEGRD